MDAICNSSQRYEQKKSGKIYMDWFTITAMDMFEGKEIEIIFRG